MPKKRLPTWLTVILFVVPLVWSEYMFYVVNKWYSMVLFPIAWVGFWLSLYRMRQREE
ncbi:MAG: hypothetical protein H5T91_06095 [Synergistetes bacterium]|nr:hypothetical protein [Synergistota bacterium]